MRLARDLVSAAAFGLCYAAGWIRFARVSVVREPPPPPIVPRADLTFAAVWMRASAGGVDSDDIAADLLFASHFRALGGQS